MTTSRIPVHDYSSAPEARRVRAWSVLLLAGAFEVGYALAVGGSRGFSSLPWSLTAVVFFLLTLFTLSIALRTIDVGIGYAVWAGIGAVGAALLGPVFFPETFTLDKAFWLAVVIAGVVWLKLADRPEPAHSGEAHDGGRVRQLRLVVETDDYDDAVRFYRDVLGMPEAMAFAEGGQDRVAILEAGRATLELATPDHARAVDRAEGVDGRGPRLRLALEVDDAEHTTSEASSAGAAVVGPPVLTPWMSRNSRLEAPGGLELTLFEETASEQARGERVGFGVDSERADPPTASE